MATSVSGIDLVDSNPGDEIVSYPPMLEVGRGGVRRNSGYVDDEFLPQLRGRKAIKVYREMSDNSAVIGGFVNAVSLLLRQIEWRVEPARKGATAKPDAEMVEQCMQDMEHSWGDMIQEIASFLIYGWELSELVYKRRVGPWQKDPRKRSKYTDGRIGWRKIAGRSQETMLRWVFDEFGNVLGMVQMPPPRYQRIALPMNKCLLFRTTIARGSPEGRSMLRNSYEPWFYLKRLQEIEVIGAERDLAGMPVAYVPSKILNAKPRTPDFAMLQAVREVVTKVRRNEQDGLVWPFDVDDDTKQPEYKFELLSAGGSRQFDIEGIIVRLKTEILQAVLADFLQVGHESVGAYNMHTDKTGLFRTSINALAQAIADVFNRDAIPRLFALNGMHPAELPTIVPNEVDPPDLATLATFISALQAAGAQLFPDPVLENFLRDAARMPKLDDDLERVREVEQRQAAILALAQQKLQLVQTEQQAEQGALQTAQTRMGTAQTAAGMLSQADEMENPSQDPDQNSAQDPAQARRGQLAVATDKVKLAQQQEKLRQMKTRPKNKPVRKAMTVSAFGIDHARCA